MRAVQIDRPGGVEQLRVGEVDDLSPQPGEIVLDVVAAGVNRADTSQREGNYPPPPGASDILGLECSGRVAAVGDGVTGWQVGDECCALLAGGGYAEQVAVPSGQVLPVPAGVDLVTAAALPEVAATVYSNLAMVAGLRSGETLLVHGGGSGIGTFAIQLARAMDVRVLCTVGSQRKADRCRELGAEPIRYDTEDFVERARELTDGQGCDVVLDIIGAKYLAANLDVLAVEGRLVVIGLQGGRRAEIDLSVLQRKRATLSATTLRARPAEEKAEICRAVVDHVWPLVADRRILPIVDTVLPLAEVARAHELVESSGHIGKVLLSVG